MPSSAQNVSDAGLRAHKCAEMLAVPALAVHLQGMCSVCSASGSGGARSLERSVQMTGTGFSLVAVGTIL